MKKVFVKKNIKLVVASLFLGMQVQSGSGSSGTPLDLFLSYDQWQWYRVSFENVEAMENFELPMGDSGGLPLRLVMSANNARIDNLLNPPICLRVGNCSVWARLQVAEHNIQLLEGSVLSAYEEQFLGRVRARDEHGVCFYLDSGLIQEEDFRFSNGNTLSMELTQAFSYDESSALRVLAEFHERWLYDPYKCNNEGRNAEGLAYKLGLHRVRQFYAGLRESLRSVRILGNVDSNGRQMEIALATKDVPMVIYLLKVVDPQRIRFQGTGNTFLMEIIEGFHEDEAIRIIQACFKWGGYNPYMYNNNRENAQRVALRMGFDSVVQLFTEDIQHERQLCALGKFIKRKILWHVLARGEEVVRNDASEMEGINDLVARFFEQMELYIKRGGGNFPVDNLVTPITGQTPLTFVVRSGDLSLVKLLVNAGANVNVPNFQRESPVDIALRVVDEEGRKEPRDVARLLNYRSIVAALDIRLPEERLEEAVINENLDEVRNILQQGGVVDINWRNNGYTLLMWAVTTGNVDIVRELLEAGADKSITYKGQTALDIAKKNHLQPVIDLL